MSRLANPGIGTPYNPHASRLAPAQSNAPQTYQGELAAAAMQDYLALIKSGDIENAGDAKLQQIRQHLNMGQGPFNDKLSQDKKALKDWAELMAKIPKQEQVQREAENVRAATIERIKNAERELDAANAENLAANQARSVAVTNLSITRDNLQKLAKENPNFGFVMPPPMQPSNQSKCGAA
jgi:type VI protein secretion system component VasF